MDTQAKAMTLNEHADALRRFEEEYYNGKGDRIGLAVRILLNIAWMVWHIWNTQERGLRYYDDWTVTHDSAESK